jgi:hypothetical protein
MTFQPRPPLFVFGRVADDVFVGSTAAAAAEHVRSHLDTDDDLADFEVFDFDGTPLAYSVADDTFSALRPWEYLQARVQGLTRRLTADPGPDPQEATLLLAKGLADGDAAEFATRVLELASLTNSAAHARVPGRQPQEPQPGQGGRVLHPHPGSFGHNLCHRMHLCD